MRKFDCNLIEQKLGYVFKDKDLLKSALIHSSYANEHNVKSNERLEFLGDSVLSLIITDYIFKHYENNEGDLSKIRASLVSEKSLSFMFEQMQLADFIFRGVGLEETKPTKAMMADAFEALVASIYLDGGIGKASKFVLTKFSSAMSNINKTGVPDSNKSKLQEKIKNAKIIYQTATEGVGQDKIYNSRVYINGIMSGIGSATKKRDAEELAALEALKSIKKV